MPALTVTLTELIFKNGWLPDACDSRVGLKWLTMSSGDTSFHDNVLLFCFLEKKPEPSLVVKACRLPENGWMLKKEFNHLKTLRGLLKAEAVNFVPRPIAFMTIGNQPLLIMEYLQGDDFQNLNRKNYWHCQSNVKNLLCNAAVTIRRLHNLTAQIIIPGEIIDSDFPNKSKIFLQMFDPDQQEVKIVKELVQYVNYRNYNAKAKFMLQGDYWHGNLIGSRDNNRYSIVDWQFARWTTDASFDIYLFPMGAAIKASSGNNVTERAAHVVQILHVWFKDIFPTYIASYGAMVKDRILPIDEGMLLSCIEKAARSISDFGHRHKDDNLWIAIFRELVKNPLSRSS